MSIAAADSPTLASETSLPTFGRGPGGSAATADTEALGAGVTGGGGVLAALRDEKHGLVDNWLRHVQDVRDAQLGRTRGSTLAAGSGPDNSDLEALGHAAPTPICPLRS